MELDNFIDDFVNICENDGLDELASQLVIEFTHPMSSLGGCAEGGEELISTLESLLSKVKEQIKKD